MKIQLYVSYITFIGLFFCAGSAKSQEDSYSLWYNSPAAQWTDALPLGNGRIGAMVFGGVEGEHVQFNEETFWNGGPRVYNRKGAYQYLPQIRQLLTAGKQKEAEQLAEEQFMGLKAPAGGYQASYQPFGDLFLNFNSGNGQVSNYRRELYLSNAIAKTCFSVNGISYTREYFVSQPDQAIVIHLTASKAGAISFEAGLSSPHKNYSVKKLDNNTLELSVQIRNGALRGKSCLKVDMKSGHISIKNDTLIKIEAADEVTLYLTAATNYVNYKDVSGDPAEICHKAFVALKGRSYAQIKGDHIREYQKHYNTFSINLGKGDNEALPTDERLEKFGNSNDPSFAALYVQYGRYLLISCSRPGTRPANLQGIWNELLSPPWGSKYTTNINLEMNYWPAELLNLSAEHQPLIRMIEELAEAGAETAKEYYNARGWVLHHNTDLWRGTAPINKSNHGIWVTGGAWLSYHLWEHYQFTQDREFLTKTGYPIMKGAALFFVDFLVEDPKTGWLISSPSNSPENGGLVAGPTMDHQIVRTLFKSCIEASELLGKDVAFRDTLKAKLSKIAPNQIGKHGQLQEWLEDKDDITYKHRHVSHLWGVYPGNDITWETDSAQMKAARQSLLYRGDEATGWSLAWKINFWARFKENEHAMELVKLLLRPTKGRGGSYVNLFDAHPPFQIDGNFGGAAGIAEMLIQSHTNYIDLLPALPSAFRNGSVKGIKARGGFEFNMEWENGKLTVLEVISFAGNTCKIRYNNKVKELKTVKGGKYKVI